MPRQLRIQYPGAMYHVMSRGNRRQDIFLDDVDRLLGEHGLQQDGPLARQEFQRRLEAQRLERGDEESLKALRRGWCLGSREFKNQILEEVEGQVSQTPKSASVRLLTAAKPRACGDPAQRSLGI